MNSIVFLISWLVSGLISTLIMLIHDFRGTEYNESDFDGDFAFACFMMTLCGYVGIILIAIYILDKKIMHSKGLGFYIHKLVNIGVKKERK